MRTIKGWKFNRGMTYQKKLTLIFSGIMIGTVCVFLIVLYAFQKDNAKKSLYRSVYVENQKNAAAIGNIMESVRDLGAALTLNEKIYGHLAQLPDIVASFDVDSLDIQQEIFKTMLISKLATMNQMEYMRLYSVSGKCVTVTKEQSAVEERVYTDQEWYTPFCRNNKDFAVFLNNEGEGTRLTFVRKVMIPIQMNVVGYLEVKYDFSHEEKNILEATALEGRRFYHISLDGNILVSDNVQEYGTQAEYDTESLLACEADIGTLRGKKYVLSAAPIKKTDFILVSGTEYDTFYEGLKKEYGLMLIILTAGVLLSVIVSMYAARGLSRNIRKLNAAMRYADKNPDIQVDIRSGDEIGLLGESFNKMIVRLKRSYEELYKKELSLKEAQNLALQAQINPHFLYNTLETIDALSVCERTEEIGRIVQSLSRVFRYAMEEKKQVTLKEEMDHVNEYMNILKMRYENKFDYEIIIENQTEEFLMPKMILQPLAENAVTHGILKSEKKGHVTISSYMESSNLYITVKDDGRGMTEEEKAQAEDMLRQNTEKQEESRHIGVKNIDRRLKFYFGDSYHMEISSSLGKGTVVSIIIEKEKKDGNSRFI